MEKEINFEPMSNWIVVEKAKEHLSDKGAIVVSQVSKNNQYTGKVVAVGPGRYAPITGTLIPMSVKVGDSVYFNPFTPDDIKIEGVQYLILREDDVQVRPKQHGKTKKNN